MTTVTIQPTDAQIAEFEASLQGSDIASGQFVFENGELTLTAHSSDAIDYEAVTIQHPVQPPIINLPGWFAIGATK